MARNANSINREIARELRSGNQIKCECPLNCRYCGRRRSKDPVGHYCKTDNCQWKLGFSTCEFRKVRKNG